MAVAAALLGCLLPSVGRAREMSRSVACLSNLRQMATATAAYAGRYNGSYPIAYYSAYTATSTASFAWDITTIWGPGMPTRVVGGLIWEGQDVSHVQQCPSFEGSANWLSDPYTGYNYNTSFIGRGQFESIPSPARVAEVRDPAGTALFGDGQYGGGANKFMRSPQPAPGDRTFTMRWAGTQGYRHMGRTNVVYCDGHAESQSERHTANSGGAVNVADQTGFLAADNSPYDLR